MGWWNKVKLRYSVRCELWRQKNVLEAKVFSLRHQLIQIDSQAKRSFSFPYRIKSMELLDIDEQLGMLERELRRRSWFWILTGRLCKN